MSSWVRVRMDGSYAPSAVESFRQVEGQEERDAGGPQRVDEVKPLVDAGEDQRKAELLLEPQRPARLERVFREEHDRLIPVDDGKERPVDGVEGGPRHPGRVLLVERLDALTPLRLPVQRSHRGHHRHGGRRVHAAGALELDEEGGRGVEQHVARRVAGEQDEGAAPR